jgi:hypothetical protein
MRNGGNAPYWTYVGKFTGSDKADLVTFSEKANPAWDRWAAVAVSTGASFLSSTWAAQTPTHMRNGN